MIRLNLTKTNLVILGAINGLILGLLPILPYAFVCFSDDCKGYETLPSGGTIDLICICKYVNWLLPLEAAIIIAIACFLFGLKIYRNVKSEIFCWQIIGIIGLCGYLIYNKLLYPFVHHWRVCYPENNDLIVCKKPSLKENLFSFFLFSQNDLFQLLVVFLIFIVFNLLFAFVIKKIFRFKSQLL
jgi:hypothetical protein